MELLPLKPMALLLSAWGIMFLMFAGVGLAASGFFCKRNSDVPGWLSLFWVGWALTLFILQIWHLFLKVDGKALALVAVLGVASLAWRGRLTWPPKTTRAGVDLILFLIATAIISNRAVLPPIDFDSGLYHLSSVAWVAQYPIVPGLGNLQNHLAFNSAYFLYAALFEVFRGEAHHFVNGLLILALAAEIFAGLRQALKDESPRPQHLFRAFLLFPLVRMMYDSDVSSPSPDFAVFILGLVLASRFLTFLSKPAGERSDYDIFVITTLSIAGVIVKLSFIAMGAVTVLLAVGVWFFGSGAVPRKSQVRLLACMSACAIIAFAVWVIRSVVLTGYPLYPSAFGAFPVEWRIPRASVINTMNWIKSWARLPYTHWSNVLGNWNWVWPWLRWASKDGPLTVFAPMGLAAVAAIAILYRKFRQPLASRELGSIWLLLLPAVASAAFWFFSAPAPRFAGAAFWILSAGALTLAVYHTRSVRELLLLSIICSALLFLRFFVHGEGDFFRVLIRDRDFQAALQQLRLNLAYSTEGGGFNPTPSVPMKRFETDSGLVVYTPAEGEQCWQAPLPCTPFPHSALTLRKHDDVGSGFMVYPGDESYATVGVVSDFGKGRREALDRARSNHESAP